MLAQIAALAGAALWFVLQAVARPEFKNLCAGTGAGSNAHTRPHHARRRPHGRHDGPRHARRPPEPPRQQMPSPCPQPTTPWRRHPDPAVPACTPALAILPALFFPTAALVFLILLLRGRRTTHTLHHTPPRPPARTNHALEALGAAAMALMFATMTT